MIWKKSIEKPTKIQEQTNRGSLDLTIFWFFDRHDRFALFWFRSRQVPFLQLLFHPDSHDTYEARLQNVDGERRTANRAGQGIVSVFLRNEQILFPER